MQQRLYRIRPPSNPVVQFFALVGGAILAIGAIFVGAIVLSFFLGLAVIAGLVLYIRLWWLQRRAGKMAGHGPRRDDEYVQVEYSVVRERSVSDNKSKGLED